MATIKKTTTPPLVAAKMVKSTSESAPKTLPPGVKVETGEKEDLGTHWEKKSRGNVQEMSNQLQKLGLKPTGGGSTEFMNWEKKDETELESPTQTIKQIKVSDKQNPISQHTGADVSGRMQVMEGLKEMYRAADKAGYKTRDQFATAYDNLLNTTSERNRKLLKDPMLQKQLSNLKDVSAQHFADLVKSRDEAESKKAPKGTVTDNNSSYSSMGSYNKAQTPAAIKLTVKKK